MKLSQVHETQVYVNANGHLVIRQDQYPEEAVHLILPKTYAAMVANEINRLIDEGCLSDFSVDDEEGGA